MHAPNAALLIDFDNVTLGIQKDLTKELRTLLNSDIIKGKVAVQRAYADWRRYPQYIVPLSESSIDLIFAPAFGSSKKNATDIRLAIDAIELVFTRPEIGTFILLSGDSDFSTMVIKLKEYGKYVIGVGIRESASDLLIQNCDEYYSYNDLAGLTKEVDTPSTQRDPVGARAEAVAQMARNGDVMRSDRLKQVMQQIDPNFDERNAGFNRFSKFVIEAGPEGRRAGDQAGQRAVRGRPWPGAAVRRGGGVPRLGRRRGRPGRGRRAAPGAGRMAAGAGGAGGAGVDASDRDARGRRHTRSPRGGPRSAGRRPRCARIGRGRPDPGARLPAHDPGAWRSSARRWARRRSGSGWWRCTGGRTPCSMPAASSGCCGRRTTPKWPTFGRWATTITRFRAQGALVAAPAPTCRSRARSCNPRRRTARAASGAGSSGHAGERPAVRAPVPRGSRAPLRAGEIPSIGVVQIEAPPEPPQPTRRGGSATELPTAKPRPTEKPARPRRGGRGSGPRPPAKGLRCRLLRAAEAAAPAPPKRPRARARKKAE